MKKKLISTLIFLTVFSGASHAGEAEDKALKVFAKTAIETAATQLVKDTLNDFVKKELIEKTVVDTFLVKEFGKKATTGLVNQAFAAYNLFESVNAFGDADTQSQKYYAAVSSVAAMVSFVNPAIGSLISLVNTVSQLVSGLLTKSKVKDLLKLQKEIVEINQKIQDNHARLAKSDVQNIGHLFNTYIYYFKESIVLDDLVEKNCEILSKTDMNNISSCFDYIIQRQHNLKLAVSSLDLALSFSSLHVDVDSFLSTISDGNLSYKKLKENMVILRSTLADSDDKLLQTYKDFGKKFYQLALETESFRNKKLIDKVSCQTSANTNLAIANKLEIDLMSHGINLNRVNSLLTVRYQRLNTLVLNIEQCLLIHELNESESKNLTDKLSLASRMLKKDFSDYLVFRFQSNI